MLKKKSSRGSKKNSTRMPTKGKKEQAKGGTPPNPLAFVVRRTNEAAVRTVLSDTTSPHTHTHCENAAPLPPIMRETEKTGNRERGYIALMV